MLSGRYFKGVPKFPSALDYNPEFNVTSKLDIKLTRHTTLKLTGMYQDGEYSAGSGLAYISSQDNLSWHGSAWNNEIVEGLARNFTSCRSETIPWNRTNY